MAETTPIRDPMTGRLLPGAKLAGGGNPNAKRMHELRKQILATTTEEQVKNVMDALYKQAVEGDVPACTTWLKYTVGPPPQAIEISTGDDSVKVDMQGLTAVILGALSDLPEARVKVAAALRASRLAQLEGNGDEPSD
jgi:hypothetical protein